MAEKKKVKKKIVKTGDKPPVPPKEDERDLSSDAKETAPEKKHDCAGCEFFWDNYKNPNIVGSNRARARKGSKPIRQELLCTCISPSESVEDGKRLDPCPGHGEEVGVMKLTPDEMEVIHARRLKEGKVKAEKN